MSIEWRDSLSVGNDFIDDDHKKLFVLINQYEIAVQQKNPVILEDAFNGLVEYAHSHFEREQNLMEAVHYPDRRAHADQHTILIDSMDDFHKSLTKEKSIDIGKVSKFLHDWLIDHVINEDMKLKPYVKGKRY
ncbi:MAG: hemerythrin family protein [Rhodospirillaceae bacterium]|nr:hemerythrin family protein [Rhodospirillaceae bacterium]MBL6941532.1 hemerythrin family protein [Rhodospirillales bacterium]